MGLSDLQGLQKGQGRECKAVFQLHWSFHVPLSPEASSSPVIGHPSESIDFSLLGSLVVAIAVNLSLCTQSLNLLHFMILQRVHTPYSSVLRQPLLTRAGPPPERCTERRALALGTGKDPAGQLRPALSSTSTGPERAKGALVPRLCLSLTTLAFSSHFPLSPGTRVLGYFLLSSVCLPFLSSLLSAVTTKFHHVQREAITCYKE